MDEMMQGLGGQGLGQQNMDSIAEIIRLLMQGVAPEDLIAQGVPRELVESAMQKITMDAEAAQQSQGPSGLAQSLVAGPQQGMM